MWKHGILQKVLHVSGVVHMGKAVGEKDKTETELACLSSVFSKQHTVRSSSTCRPVPYVRFLTIIGHTEYTEEVLSDGLVTVDIFGEVGCSTYNRQLKIEGLEHIHKCWSQIL